MRTRQGRRVEIAPVQRPPPLPRVPVAVSAGIRTRPRADHRISLLPCSADARRSQGRGRDPRRRRHRGHEAGIRRSRRRGPRRAAQGAGARGIRLSPGPRALAGRPRGGRQHPRRVWPHPAARRGRRSPGGGGAHSPVASPGSTRSSTRAAPHAPRAPRRHIANHDHGHRVARAARRTVEHPRPVDGPRPNGPGRGRPHLRARRQRDQRERLDQLGRRLPGDAGLVGRSAGHGAGRRHRPAAAARQGDRGGGRRTAEQSVRWVLAHPGPQPLPAPVDYRR